MGVNRRFLYAGVFLLAVGGVLFAADLDAIDGPTLIETVGLWPLAVIAIGAGLVLRRSEFSLPAGVLAAALAGLLLGGAFAAAPSFAGDCGVRGQSLASETRQGTFDGPATVSVIGGCGSINVTTAPGNAWRLEATNTAGRAPVVRPSSTALSIAANDDEGWHFLTGGRDTWALTLPTTDIESLSLVVHLGDGVVSLPGAKVERLAVNANASRLVVDASTAAVEDLSAAVNFGSVSVQLPAGSDMTGSLRAGAGELKVCSSPGVGLRLTSAKDFGRRVLIDGEQHDGAEWQSADYATAAHKADLRLSVNLGSVEINPIGGCR